MADEKTGSAFVLVAVMATRQVGVFDADEVHLRASPCLALPPQSQPTIDWDNVEWSKFSPEERHRYCRRTCTVNVRVHVQL